MTVIHPYKLLKNIVLERLRFFELGECGRIFHGRGSCYGGLEALTVDKFGPVLVVILYRKPDDMAILEQEMAVLLSLSDRLTHLAFQFRFVRPTQWYWPGESLDGCIGYEDGIAYRLRFDHQNPGLFLDMQEGRRWVRAYAAGKRIANLFSYTCAFSVVAEVAGCLETVNFDMSRSALNAGRENIRLNQGDVARHRLFDHDILKSLGKITRLSPFDLVIIDPPVRQDSFDPVKGYQRILLRVRDWVVESGYLLVTMNEPTISVGEFRTMLESRLGEGFDFIRRLPSARFVEELRPDYGLKVLLYQKSPASSADG
ncbi:class I SAM-dependent methyltransferase [Gynuella sunshinyii]|uniref:Putative SAM-dependent methyltransferase n=1 Tax=Gynuella sunshinyii YC6258 TaxID=1445510 RepID=A0A0C5VKW2_9GAMM|nr:class I SAM-dependent methyltransferase [Gynuella sunshinyii]AJQ94946.1 putative SAM-dependent methyltransferase [Gynuella sunshinyii YC6258]